MKNLIITLTIFLSACVAKQEPAQIIYHGQAQGGGSENQVTQQTKIYKEVQTHEVLSENIISSDIDVDDELTIAEKDALDKKTQKKIKKSNNIKEEKLVLDKPKVVNATKKTVVNKQNHLVKKGDTLFSISRKYNIPIQQIVRANNLKVPYDVNTGQKILIPKGIYHTVFEGDTLYSISRAYNVDMSGIVRLNNMQKPFQVVKGQKLQIPFPTGDLVEDKKEEQVVKTGLNKNLPVSLRKKPTGELGKYKTKQKIKSDIGIATKPQKDKPEKKINYDNNGKFVWPLKGKIIKKFGQQNGEYNDGINISASSGTQVKASNSGRVVYTGNSLKSYGNLIIIKHNNGLLSAYAHLNSLNVKKDQKVAKGQVIGRVGSTGKVTSSQLYFAIRKGKQARDPLKYLN